MNFRRCFDNFNPSRFFVFSMLFVFTILMAMKCDKLLNWSYWAVFIPLWVWKFVVVIGFLSGTVAWCHNPHYHLEAHSQYKAMAMSTAYQVVLLFFEVLACDRLESGRNEWLFIFIPLLLLSMVGIGVCVWAMKHDQKFELELVLSVNILLFIFIALKLDGWITWTWTIVFIPLWIVMSVATVLEFYGLILALILCRSPDLLPEQRRHTIFITTGYAFVIFPLLAFEILFAKKMDHEINYSYLLICCPLLLAFSVLIVMSFVVRGDNPWWFGFRKPLCQIILEVCEPLQEYGNVSYKLHNLWNLDDESINEINTEQPTNSSTFRSHFGNRQVNISLGDITFLDDGSHTSPHPKLVALVDEAIRLEVGASSPLLNESMNVLEHGKVIPHLKRINMPD